MMQKTRFPNVWLLFFMVCNLFVVPGLVQAQDNATKPGPESTAGPEPVAPLEVPDQAAGVPAEPKNLNNQTYRDWLEHYGAWDKLDQVYAQDQEGPEAVLKRAQIAMQGGNPGQALELIEKTEPFEEKPFEIKRLWLGGQANRALGDPARAVLWFSQAAKLMDPAEMRDRFSKEPSLHEVWADVWRKLFWIYVNNSGVSQEGQAVFLGTVLDQAMTVWGRTTFWTSADDTFAKTLPMDTEAGVEPATNTLSVANRIVLTRYLAQVAMDRDNALATLAALGDEPVRIFWEAAHVMASQGKLMPEVVETLAQDNYFKAASFLNRQSSVVRLAGLAESRLLHGSDSFEMLMHNVKVLPPAEALAMFKTGSIQGLMAAGAPPENLDSLHFALALESGDTETARVLWPELDKTTLPPSLLLAGVILSGQDAGTVRAWGSGLDPVMTETLSVLAQAGGAAPALPHISPFWTRVDPALLKTLAKSSYPLDPDLLLTYWEQEWNAGPSSDLARRVAFLFPEENLGALCTLYLAEQAVADRQLHLAAYYLSTVEESSVNATLGAKRLEVTADWQMAEEDMDGALVTYEELVATGAEISDITRLKIAFLLQRKGRLEEGRDQLLQLWSKKDDLDAAMQAEILFYLGEGEQAMGHSDEALDHFLNLAWQYPQESMWALTAMYRAANIYETRGQYEPARKLLKTVIKNAQTDKQKAAAEARLSDIEGRMGKPADMGAGSVPYPF